MTGHSQPAAIGALCVLAASVLWGTTGTAATYALYSWAAHRLISRQIPSRAAMGAVFGIGGLLLLPVLAITGAPLVASWTNAAVGTYMALVPMFAGYVLFGWGLAHVPASTATTLSLLEPAVAAVLAVLIVGERLPVTGWAGITLVITCLAVLTTPTPNRPRNYPHPVATAIEHDTAAAPPKVVNNRCPNSGSGSSSVEQ
ncbi:DMT family transporter [Streptomyces sp. NPDC058291]|uniref:DMT family transporter n=1 Tax=Streptomyces sp. NPDC058291 TaxID=3346427 RepID=UPI0036DFC123